MIMQPSWSTMSTSRPEGGEQNRCWKICRMDSTVLGVSCRATARWPKVRMVLVEMRVDSLSNKVSSLLASPSLWPSHFCQVMCHCQHRHAGSPVF